MSGSRRTPEESFYRRSGKRILDLAGAAIMLLLLSPLLTAVAIAILWLLGKPILFRQVRPGLHARPFTLYKFRTMLPLDDEKGELADAERLTPFGAFLRRTSLDELPELWNVLRGEMSLVGPRPLLRRYLDRYSPRQARRHEVRPGITGWSQVKGRNALSWEEKLELDVWYVDRVAPGIDAKILLMTIGTVLRGRGVTAAEHATMPEFRGTRE
jgi:lipopolysaccharide/colanic/teichoic acid biosynthesis glycosyltransferase